MEPGGITRVNDAVRRAQSKQFAVPNAIPGSVFTPDSQHQENPSSPEPTRHHSHAIAAATGHAGLYMRSRSCLLEADQVAHALQLADEAVSAAGVVVDPAYEPVGAEFAIGAVVVQQVPGDHQDGVPDGTCRVEAVGGQLEVVSPPAAGTSMHVTIPLDTS